MELVETEKDRLIRLGVLTPFDQLAGFERRVQRGAAGGPGVPGGASGGAVSGGAARAGARAGSATAGVGVTRSGRPAAEAIAEAGRQALAAQEGRPRTRFLEPDELPQQVGGSRWVVGCGLMCTYISADDRLEPNTAEPPAAQPPNRALPHACSVFLRLPSSTLAHLPVSFAGAGRAPRAAPLLAPGCGGAQGRPAAPSARLHATTCPQQRRQGPGGAAQEGGAGAKGGGGRARGGGWEQLAEEGQEEERRRGQRGGWGEGRGGASSGREEAAAAEWRGLGQVGWWRGGVVTGTGGVCDCALAAQPH